jgi:hypothetical protein
VKFDTKIDQMVVLMKLLENQVERNKDELRPLKKEKKLLVQKMMIFWN